MNPYRHEQQRSDGEDWREWAACRETDAELWHPEKGQVDKVRHAKRICSHCPVQFECLEYALDTDERYGIYGGLTETERRPLRRNRITRKPAEIAARRAQVARLAAAGLNSQEIADSLHITPRQACRDMSANRQCVS